MNILPNEKREDDKETLTKEEIHEHNKQEEHRMKGHENQNPHLGNGRNPTHHDQGGR